METVSSPGILAYKAREFALTYLVIYETDTISRGHNYQMRCLPTIRIRKEGE